MIDERIELLEAQVATLEGQVCELAEYIGRLKAREAKRREGYDAEPLDPSKPRLVFKSSK
jgi:hypothetical protein